MILIFDPCYLRDPDLDIVYLPIDPCPDVVLPYEHVEDLLNGEVGAVFQHVLLQRAIPLGKDHYRQ